MLLGDYPGVVDLIGDIRRAGLATGILSNTNHAAWVRQRPRTQGGTGEFLAGAEVDYPCASHILGVMKPDQAIYSAFERLTGFASEEIQFFDDLEENVAAARTRGWMAKRIDHTGDTAAQMRSHLRAHGVRV
jgi:putative hydrolase of the HAD superfamily